MTTKHVHYKAIIAWAEGKQIEMTLKGHNNWMPIDRPSFSLDNEYRAIKAKAPYQVIVSLESKKEAKILSDGLVYSGYNVITSKA